MPLKSQSIRGLKTAWYEFLDRDPEGKNPILFFLHGFPDSPNTWKNQINYFKDFDCIAPFNRGVGESLDDGSGLSRYGLEAQLLDHLYILQLCGVRKRRKIIIIAHDLGGPYAINLARHLQDQCAGVVMINSVSLEQMVKRVVSPHQIFKSWYIYLFQLQGISDYIWDKWGDQLMEGHYKKASYYSKLKAKDVKKSLKLYRALFRDINLQLFKEDKLSIPILSLWSNKDPYLEIPTQKEMESFYQDFQLRVISGGHWLHWEKCDQISLLIKKFIEGMRDGDTKISQAS